MHQRHDTVLLPLPVLAVMIGVHVRTLHAAARSGRLGVAYDMRTTFRRLRPRATLKHALDFRRHYYGTQRRPPAKPVPLTWASVPEDYDVQLKALRRHLDISQAGFARLVGAAGKVVVYQWEARKCTPSPLFWQRVHELQSGGPPSPRPMMTRWKTASCPPPVAPWRSRPRPSSSARRRRATARPRARRRTTARPGYRPGYTDEAARCATTSRWSLLNVIREQSRNTSRTRRWNVSSAVCSLSGE